ncbi:MAG: hypothetical protein KBT18_06445 [Comamonas sp.]|nr:hypothetical protein [Candidatus Comamonas equi]
MNTETDKSLKTLTLVVYALYALSVFTGITAVVAIIINYIKKQDVQGTLYESHFRWQIRSFWFGLLWTFLAALTLFVGIGFILLPIVGIWYVYRQVKGFLRLNDGKPMYA